MTRQTAHQGADPRNADSALKSQLPVTFRRPEARDGQRVWRLVRNCAPLDKNSMYCNLLQCTHFAETCVVAEREGELVGWISAYHLPAERDALFVWQIAVAESARGLGLGKALVLQLLSAEAAGGVARLKTTITKDNEASWALFRSVALALAAPMRDEPLFDCDQDFGGKHNTEHLVMIGPFPSRRAH